MDYCLRKIPLNFGFDRFQNGQLAAICICVIISNVDHTQNGATTEQILMKRNDSMRCMEGLLVWLVITFCFANCFGVLHQTIQANVCEPFSRHCVANVYIIGVWSGCMKKLERQAQSASVSNHSPVAASEVTRSPVMSRLNGLMESVHRRSSSPLKQSLPHSSSSSSKILPDSGMSAVQ